MWNSYWIWIFFLFYYLKTRFDGLIMSTVSLCIRVSFSRKSVPGIHFAFFRHKPDYCLNLLQSLQEKLCECMISWINLWINKSIHLRFLIFLIWLILTFHTNIDITRFLVLLSINSRLLFYVLFLSKISQTTFNTKVFSYDYD